MKQFSLEDYLKQPSRKVVTREGRSARIICTDAKREYPIIALLDEEYGYEAICGFNRDGRAMKDIKTQDDLFFAPEKHEGWINVCRTFRDGEPYCACTIYQSEEVAKKMGGVATIKIEWEE